MPSKSLKEENAFSRLMISLFEPRPLPPETFSLQSSFQGLDNLASKQNQVRVIRPTGAFSTMHPDFVLDSLPASDDIFDNHDQSPAAWTNKKIEDVDMDLNEIKIEPLRYMNIVPVSTGTLPFKGESKQDCCSPSSSTISIDSSTRSSQSSESLSCNRRWKERYEDLVAFQKRFGNCCVPSQWWENPPLAQWVKRQRYQLRLRKEGMHSTMTTQREALLNDLGFTWDPHTAIWEERLDELEKFRDVHGHCNVPTKCPENPQLAIWAKVSVTCDCSNKKKSDEGNNRKKLVHCSQQLLLLVLVVPTPPNEVVS